MALFLIQRHDVVLIRQNKCEIIFVIINLPKLTCFFLEVLERVGLRYLEDLFEELLSRFVSLFDL